MDARSEEAIRDDDATRLIKFLHDRDAACPQCNYNLRNLTSPRCPECGRELTLGVALLEPELRPWIGVMVSICATAGLGSFWLFVLLAQSWPPPQLIVPILAQIVAIPAVPILIARRRSFMKRSLGAQWTLAAVAIGYALLSMGWLIGSLVLRKF